MAVTAVESPAVSIIVPTFNRLRFLQASIRSVFEQTFCDWELLIADDGSGEETKAYLRTLESLPRVRVLWLPHTGKPSAARNAALRVARGEFVALLDSDDLWLPQKLERQVAAMRLRPACRWSYTRFELIDERHEPIEWMRGGGWPTPDGWILEHVLLSKTVVSVPSVLVSRALLEQVGGFDEDLVMCEDFDLWLRLAAVSEVAAIDEPLTLVLRHAEHSGNEVIAFRDCRRVIDKMLCLPELARLRSTLTAIRAELSAQIAMAHTRRGERAQAVSVLAASAVKSWSHLQWWLIASRALARMVTPAPVRGLLRRS